MSLGTNISRLRAEKHLSQGDLAEALGVSRQSVSKWETDSSVPDLDKLVKLSRVFGVSLDELVMGENGPAEAPPEMSAAPAAQVVNAGRMPGRKIAGVILFCMGFLTCLLLTVAGSFFTGLFLAAPFLACGIICSCARKRPGLWCAWAVYLTTELYVRWATGLSWILTLRTLVFTPQENYMRLIIAWVQLIMMLVMFSVTLFSFRRSHFPLNRRNLALLGIGWAALVLLNALKNFGYTQLYELPNFSFDLELRLLLRAVDLVFLVGFAILLTATFCMVRSRKKRSPEAP